MRRVKDVSQGKERGGKRRARFGEEQSAERRKGGKGEVERLCSSKRRQSGEPTHAKLMRIKKVISCGTSGYEGLQVMERE